MLVQVQLAVPSLRGSIWLDRLPWEQEIVGSNPTVETKIELKDKGILETLLCMSGAFIAISFNNYRHVC